MVGNQYQPLERFCQIFSAKFVPLLALNQATLGEISVAWKIRQGGKHFEVPATVAGTSKCYRVMLVYAPAVELRPIKAFKVKTFSCKILSKCWVVNVLPAMVRYGISAAILLQILDSEEKLGHSHTLPDSAIVGTC